MIKNTIIFLLTIHLFAGCGENPNSGKKTLMVGAASNMQFVLDELKDDFEKVNGVKLNFTYASSGSLTEQIINGAPYDILISADDSFIEKLKSRDLLISEPSYLADGVIALGISSKSELKLNNALDLLRSEVKRITIASPSHAPYGIAALEFLKKSGLYEGVKNKLIYAENIRQALIFVSSGNVDAGIISANIRTQSTQTQLTQTHLTRSTEGLRLIDIDEELYTNPRIMGVVLKDTDNVEISEKFLEFLGSIQAKNKFENYKYKIVKSQFTRPILKDPIK